MGARFRSWWQKKRRPLTVIGIIAACIGVVVLIFIVVWFNGTGFKGKTLWDWLQLLGVLAIPVVVGFGGTWFTRVQQRRDQESAEKLGRAAQKAAEKRAQIDREISEDNQRETALQTYIDKMSELLLEKNLQGSQPEDDVRNIARARTLTVLLRLDSDRKGSLIQFLYDSHLIRGIIDLSGADLSNAKLSDAVLRSANLSYANLSGADLSSTHLGNANLSGADLSNANLSGVDLHDANLWRTKLITADLLFANLGGADLSNAYLSNAKLVCADLSRAKLSYADLSGADLFCTLGSTNLTNADLTGANLSGSNLSGVSLTEANLSDADLSDADLSDADLDRATGTTPEQLKEAKSLKGATMPDGSLHD